jgi:flagellar protein FlgJ
MMDMMGVQATPEMAQQMSKLEKSCQDFESVFTSKLLEVMRKTVPQNGLVNGGRAEEIFTGLMDEELARLIADGNGLGVGKMMFEQMQQQILSGRGITHDPKFYELGAELLKGQTGAGQETEESVRELMEVVPETTPQDLPQINDATDLLMEGLDPRPLVADSETQPVQGPLAMMIDAPEIQNTTAVDRSALALAFAEQLSDNGRPSVKTDAPSFQQMLSDLDAGDAAQAEGTVQKNGAVVIPTEMGMEAVEPELLGAEQAGMLAGRKTQQPVSDLRGQDVQTTADDDLLTGKAAQAIADKTALAMDPKTQTDRQLSTGAQPQETVRPDVVTQYRKVAMGDEKAGFSRRINRNLNAEKAAAGPATGKDTELNLDDKRLTAVNAQVRPENTQVLQADGRIDSNQTTDATAARTAALAMTADGANRLKRFEILERAQVAGNLQSTDEPAVVMSQLVKKAELLLKNGTSEMKIQLEPQHLGEVKISVVMQNDVLTAKIFAKNDAVGDIIRTNLNQLGNSLKDMGFNVGGFDVTTGGEYEQPGRSHQPQDSQSQGHGSYANTWEEEKSSSHAWNERPLFMYQAQGIYSFDVVA